MILRWLFTWGRGRKKGQMLPAKAATKPHTLPLCDLSWPQHPGQALGPSSYPTCLAGTTCEWCWTCSLACSLFWKGTAVTSYRKGWNLSSEQRACVQAALQRVSELQAALRTLQLQYGADLTCSSLHYSTTFPCLYWICNCFCRDKGPVFVYSYSFVHGSEHSSHKKSVFLSAVAMGGSHTGSKFMNKQMMWLMSIRSDFPHHTHLHLFTF